MDAKQGLLRGIQFLTETLPRPNAHTGSDSESSPVLPNTLATILMWLLTLRNVASATEDLISKFHFILSSSDLNLNTKTRFYFQKNFQGPHGYVNLFFSTGSFMKPKYR